MLLFAGVTDNCDGESDGSKGRINYHWFTSKDLETDGNSLREFNRLKLPREFILPSKVRIFHASGGGSTFGYKTRVLKVSG